jgi:hypothetical protein
MEATTLLLPGSLEPQLGLSVAPLAETGHSGFPVLPMLFLEMIDEKEEHKFLNGS